MYIRFVVIKIVCIVYFNVLKKYYNVVFKFYKYVIFIVCVFYFDKIFQEIIYSGYKWFQSEYVLFLFENFFNVMNVYLYYVVYFLCVFFSWI